MLQKRVMLINREQMINCSVGSSQMS